MDPSVASYSNAPLDAFLGKFYTEILNPAVTLLTLAAFLIFIWGVIQYIRNADNDGERKKGAKHILWGIAGLTIIFGANAIIAIIKTLSTIFNA